MPGFITAPSGGAAPAREIQQASISGAAETTVSASYVDLATPGPAVTVTVPASGKLLVSISGLVWNNTVNCYALMSFALSGANTRAAADDEACGSWTSTGQIQPVSERSVLLTGLTPGVTTVTAKYKIISGGTLNAVWRKIRAEGIS